MIDRAGIQAEEVNVCILCGHGGCWLHRGLEDLIFGIQGRWDFMRCPKCGLVWLTPRPTPEHVARLYDRYYTHDMPSPSRRAPSLIARCRRRAGENVLFARFGYAFPGRGWIDQIMGWMLSWIPTFRERMGRRIIWLNGQKNGRLLDVGCGNGEFLAYMRSLGWDVFGVEPDEAAVRAARDRFDLVIYHGTLETVQLPEAFFDSVIMNHAIEHVPDPIETMRKCHALLKPEGRIHLLTPNTDSLGHRLFGISWRGLEPPRHYHLFTADTLKRCLRLAGLTIDSVRSIAGGAKIFWRESRYLERISRGKEGSDKVPTLRQRLEDSFWQSLERLLSVFHPVGEEIVLTAHKKSLTEKR